MIKQEKKFEGIVTFQRSEDEDGLKCSCCEGKHIYCRYVNFKEDPKEVMTEMLRECTGKDKEGRKVTMEIKIKLHDLKGDKDE